MLFVNHVDKLDVGVERRSVPAFHPAGSGDVVIDKAQRMTRRLERRKLQRNRTAFTLKQIEQLEQGPSYAFSVFCLSLWKILVLIV